MQSAYYKYARRPQAIVTLLLNRGCLHTVLALREAAKQFPGYCRRDCFACFHQIREAGIIEILTTGKIEK